MTPDSRSNDDIKQHLLNIEARLDRLSASSQLNFDTLPVAYRENEVDLRELFMALWEGKWAIIAITFIFAVGSTAFALMQPNIYKASALLVSAERGGGGGLSRMAGQLGGLAALAAVNLGRGEASPAELATEIIRSRQFVGAFIQKHELLVPLMAAQEWKRTTNTLVLDRKVYDEQNNVWLRKADGMHGATPTAQEAYKVFTNKSLSISRDKETGLYTLAVSHVSPYIAQQWVNWLIEDINEVMRERAIREATRNLEYLSTQLQKTAVADMQAALYQLVEEQTKSLMLAEVQEEFAFKVIDPPVAPISKNQPRRALICVIGTLFGGFLGGGFVLTMAAFRNEENGKH